MLWLHMKPRRPVYTHFVRSLLTLQEDLSDFLRVLLTLLCWPATFHTRIGWWRNQFSQPWPNHVAGSLRLQGTSSPRRIIRHLLINFICRYCIINLVLSTQYRFLSSFQRFVTYFVEFYCMYSCSWIINPKFTLNISILLSHEYDKQF